VCVGSGLLDCGGVSYADAWIGAEGACKYLFRVDMLRKECVRLDAI
jgi:hypothetical protein